MCIAKEIRTVEAKPSTFNSFSEHPACFRLCLFKTSAMEEFYDAQLNSIEAYIDAAGFQLVSLDLPS